MKRFIFVIVLTLTVAAGASGASTRSASIPSKSVLLVCTSTAALNYAEVIQLQTMTGSAATAKALSNAAATYGKAAILVGAPFYGDAVNMARAMAKFKTGLGPMNSVFATEAGQCRAHGDPIVLFTLS
jgi:hypothetical protein